MNRKILTIFALFLIVVSVATVCAAELTEEKDFEGNFKMNVVENETFSLMSQGNNGRGLLESDFLYVNGNETIAVFVYNEDMDDSLFHMTYGDYDAEYHNNDANVTMENGMAFFNKTQKMAELLKGSNFDTFVGVSDSNHNMTVFVAGKDPALVKEYASTIKFE